MRRNGWLQKVLYMVMGVLGLYLLYKGGGLLLNAPQMQNVLDEGSVQRFWEDTAMRTWAPGYTAAVEGTSGGSWMSAWMEQLVPVYSYVVREADTEMEKADVKDRQESAETISEAAAAVETGTETDSGAAEMAVSEAAAVVEAGTETDSGAAAETAVPEAAALETALPEETALEKDTPASTGEDEEIVQTAAVGNILEEALQQLSDFDFLLSSFYTVDSGTSVSAELLDAEALLTEDLSLVKNSRVPQILIYHTHSQEAFADSTEGEEEDSIVGMGEILAEELRSCGYNVIHDTGVYDLVDGVSDRSAAYDYAREAVEAILQKYPTIEVVIDLHRDGLEGEKQITEIDGKPTSVIMFFNGLSQDENGQALSWLPNSYLKQNLAFSLQLEVLAREEYPGFTRNIYLKAERYNLHLRPRSLLIEAGSQLNTVEEEKNAMKPLAKLIDQVLS